MSDNTPEMPTETESQPLYAPLEPFRPEYLPQPTIIALPVPTPYNDSGLIPDWSIQKHVSHTVAAHPECPPEVVAEADFISLHARSTKETENLFDAARFRQMKRGSYFINTARDTLVDEEALFDAITSGHLAGAALDVTRPRPDGSAPASRRPTRRPISWPRPG